MAGASIAGGFSSSEVSESRKREGATASFLAMVVSSVHCSETPTLPHSSSLPSSPVPPQSSLSSLLSFFSTSAFNPSSAAFFLSSKSLRFCPLAEGGSLAIAVAFASSPIAKRINSAAAESFFLSSSDLARLARLFSLFLKISSSNSFSPFPSLSFINHLPLYSILPPSFSGNHFFQ